MTGWRRFSIILAVLFLVCFAFVAFQLKAGKLTGFDSKIYGLVTAHMSNSITIAMKGLTSFCSVQFIGVLIVLFCIIGIRKQNLRFYNSMMLLNLVCAWLINFALKTSFHRDRPNFARLVNETGFSFPSTHAMVSAAFYGFLVYLCIVFLKKPIKQILSAILILLVLMIGISRVYLGVHYASDVTAGILLGFAWVILFTYFIDKVHTRPGTRKRGRYVLRSRR